MVRECQRQGQSGLIPVVVLSLQRIDIDPEGGGKGRVTQAFREDPGEA
jgi:hypothetical protein